MSWSDVVDSPTVKANPNQPTVTGQTRDVLKSGINLPILGTVSIAALGIIGLLFFFNRRAKSKRYISIGV